VTDPANIVVYGGDTQTEIANGHKETINKNGILVGESWTYRVCVHNTGTRSLTVEGFSLDAEPCAGEDDGSFSVQIDGEHTFPAEVSPTGMGDATGLPETVCAVVKFTRIETGCAQAATLHIANNTDDESLRDFTVEFEVAEPAPHISANPEFLDFGMIEETGKVDDRFSILNTGLGDLMIWEVRYRSAKQGFSFQWSCEGPDGELLEEYYLVESAIGKIGHEGETTICGSPVIIPPNSSIQVPAFYGAQDEAPAKAFLTFVSNDPDFDGAHGQGLEVELWANVSGPCLKADPEVVDFGTVMTTTMGVEFVDLVSCGDETVDVTGIELSEDCSDDYTLDLASLGDFSEEDPLSIDPGPGTSETFTIKYLPLSVDKDVEEKVLPDTCTVLIYNSSATSPREVPVTGMGIAGESPVAAFKVFADGVEVPDGGDVLVQTTLDLMDQSYDPTTGGGIVGYEWSVQAPNGSADFFYPSPKMPYPQFEANMVGDHLFRLKVFNKVGYESGNVAEHLVHVKAGEGCHVELVWNTPNDPDPTDQCAAGKDCGTDMDLHVVHPYASTPDVDKDGKPDGFFDIKYDCFWFNPHPTWVDGLDTLYQPHLDRDDTDGGGPENFNYVQPESGKCYKVGVHYWDDHGFGASYPTVRMFIDGDLMYEKTLTNKMNFLDMWEVGEACCFDKNNPFIEYTYAGAEVIIDNYVNPEFNFTP